MNAFLERQIREALAPLEQMMLRLLRKTALALLALVSLCAGLVFLSVATYIALSGLIGSVYAAVALAFFYVSITLTCLLAMRSAARPKQSRASVAKETGEAVKQASATAESQSRPEPGGFENPRPEHKVQSENIDRTLAPIIAILEQAGLDRANIALAVGGEIAKQIRPLTLVVTAFVTGFVFGRR